MELRLCDGVDGPRLCLTDSRGKDRQYRIEPVAADRGLTVVRLVRDDNANVYRLTRIGSGRWSCTCRAYQYQPGPCKHCRALEMLHTAAEVFARPCGMVTLASPQ